MFSLNESGCLPLDSSVHTPHMHVHLSLDGNLTQLVHALHAVMCSCQGCILLENKNASQSVFSSATHSFVLKLLRKNFVLVLGNIIV